MTPGGYHAMARGNRIDPRIPHGAQIDPAQHAPRVTAALPAAQGFCRTHPPADPAIPGPAAEDRADESAEDQRRASRMRLNGVSVARRNWVKPLALAISSSLACPACAPSTCVPFSEIAWAQHSMVEPA